MKIYNPQQAATEFYLSIPELYEQLRNLGIISGENNRPVSKYLKAGYFVDRRETPGKHLKFEMTQKGIYWLAFVVKITWGDLSSPRECYHCKRRKHFTMIEFEGHNRRTCSKCEEKLKEIESGESFDMPMMPVVNRNRQARQDSNASYYGGP